MRTILTLAVGMLLGAAVFGATGSERLSDWLGLTGPRAWVHVR